MKLDTFIKRPILSAVISVLIVLVGILSVLTLPIEKYPDIAPPTVKVTTNFYGANAETLIKSVITPLEEAINGVEDMIYMSSSATNTGNVSISVVFAQGSDVNKAVNNVQNRVNKASALLPAEVKQFGITVEKSQNSMLQVISISSPDDTYNFEFLGNYASINVKPRVMLINGIGEFEMLGSDYSMRVWLNPSSLSQHNLTPEDIANALATQNIEAATGSFGANSSETFQYTMRYTGRFKSVEEFENVIIRADSNGNILRLKDVAEVSLGTENYMFNGETNGHPGVLCIAYQAAGSNATQVNNEIDAVIEQLRKEAPSGIEFKQIMSTNDFLYAAIQSVIDTLRDAIILVILIVLLFLKDFKSTLIPFISIMVSLIGTFAFMQIAGFSINLLTLFALVLVIGTVVDDSIVVVEAVHAKFEEGVKSPFKATVEAVGEVALPVITSSLVFMAVFVPVSFMGGTSGVFYKQFGLTMAVAVGISAINALTLVPAISAILLKPLKKIEKNEKGTFKQRYARWFDGLFDRFSKGYQKILAKAIKVKGIVWAVAIIGLVALVVLLKVMPSGLVPDDDQGILMVEITNPPGTSLSATTDLTRQISEKILKVPGVLDCAATSGYGMIAGGSSSSAVIFVKLDHWDNRKSDEKRIASIYQNINTVCAEFPQASCLVFSMPMIPGYGTSSNIDMYIQDRKGGSIEDLDEVTKNFVNDIQKDGLYGFYTFNMDFPQWEVSVDVAKCMRAGVSPKELLGTLSAYYSGSYVSDLNLFSKVYKVMIQSDPECRRDEYSLDQTYIRTVSGEMAPLSNFVSLKRVYGPESIKNFNKFTAINVSIASEMSTGEALEKLQSAATNYLPEGYTIDFAGMAREQKSQGSLGLILLLCTFIIYLILAALYESLVIPFSVLLTVPLGLAGAFGVSLLVGLDNNIYVQTGVIMLIGLLAKTGILITEYAVDRHKKGMDIDQAAIEAAGARLRPIIMTVATMVIGLFPLVASVGGVGGMGNFSLGLGTIVGMTIGTVGLLFIVPTLYTSFQRLHDKMQRKESYEE